ncbi:hypothetical protein SAMN04487981_13810 [Streptomyces sp. cf386]|uniref:hypothetical protein n=1 Tax=Streptomyces sp. cf386 TaxID=1761904 RepID=UPI000889481F|nr:hypothetical protein [Streptomyces sp. cf386]SDP75881.1 hypothetical protein SAMN04487981_13810 [Streptomyces sp. cf386]
MSSSGGYDVQRSGMSSEADKLDRAGDDTGNIRTAISALPCYSSDALGGSDSGPAYTRFAAAWQAEAKVLEEALHELADKVRVSSQAYGGAEQQAVAGLRSAVAGSGAGPTPTPPPAGGVPVTTSSPFG